MAMQRLIWRYSSFPPLKVEQRPPFMSCAFGKEMSFSVKSTAAASDDCTQKTRKLPILLFDIMDTLVRDPFYHDIPAFFGMSMKELLECKHPTAWIEFEKGLIDEMELAQIFFKDGRSFNLEGLKSCMRQGYSYIQGVEGLLVDLKKNGYEMHASTNYPIWYEMIEEKLELSTYLSWTFCSCIMGKRKPDTDFYMEILKQLNVEPECCVFVDDSMTLLILTILPQDVLLYSNGWTFEMEYLFLEYLLENREHLGWNPEEECAEAYAAAINAVNERFSTSLSEDAALARRFGYKLDTRLIAS